MRKIAIFNVGGAMAAYAEINGYKYLYDIGAGNSFSPVKDFLLPLFETRGEQKSNKYLIDQLILSHLDADHISDYKNFRDFFHPYLLTVPSDHPDIGEHLKVSRKLISINEVSELILSDMKHRQPGEDSNNPLWVCDDSTMLLNYLSPSICENLDSESDSEYSNYRNNISLQLYITVNGYSVLFTGDMMKDGMQYLMNNHNGIASQLSRYGLDILICPHHGLDTSFSGALFNKIESNKVSLNIISEKRNIKSESDTRHNVDARYYSSEYAHGMNVINGKLGTQYGIITSLGHIVIDFDDGLKVKRITSNEDLIKEFV